MFAQLTSEVKTAKVIKSIVIILIQPCIKMKSYTSQWMNRMSVRIASQPKTATLSKRQMVMKNSQGDSQSDKDRCPSENENETPNGKTNVGVA